MAVLNEFHERTQKALLWMNLSHEPFVVLYALLPFILRKDLQASLLQISILSALRPILPVFSFYWSSNLSYSKHRLRANLIGAWFLGRLPFLFVPWVSNVWYLIFCCAMYEFFNKSGIPALIEILRINIPKGARENTYTTYFVLTFLESCLLGVFIAGILDSSALGWQWLCGCTAFLSLTSIYLQMKVPIPIDQSSPLVVCSVQEKIKGPWQEALKLLQTNPEFARFQYGFMMGGFGLMLIAPSLSIFYVDVLNLSHADVVTGRSILMGIGITLSSYFWRMLLTKRLVPLMTRWILIGFSFYLLSLVLSGVHMLFFYSAFFLYGIAQAGSHLLWNLSGSLFAEEGDSFPFSRLNILMLGIRGAIAPALGGFLCSFLGPIPMLITGSGICLAGAYYMRQPVAVVTNNTIYQK